VAKRRQRQAAAKRTQSAGPRTLSRDPGQQADNHRQARAARRRERTEDYVEVVADLIEASGEARVVDIAQRLGVSHVTVVKTIERLQAENLVRTRPYRSIFLTDAGWEMARFSRGRHETVLGLLLAIGVREETAHADAEGIEHHVSAETLAAFERFTKGRKS